MMTNAMTVMTSTAEDIEKENSTITFRHIRYCTGRWGPHAADTIQVGLMDQAVLLPAVTRKKVAILCWRSPSPKRTFFVRSIICPNAFISFHFQILIRIRALNGRFHWIQPDARFGFGNIQAYAAATR